MLVSFIIIAYNAEKFLDKSLESLKKQDYPHKDIEVILVDSISTDGTRKVFEEFKKENEKDFYQIKILTNKGKTLPKGWNVALKEVTGEVVLRVDAHTFFDKDFIWNNVKEIENGENIVGGKCISVTQNNDWKEKLLLIAEESIFGCGIADFRRKEKIPADDRGQHLEEHPALLGAADPGQHAAAAVQHRRFHHRGQLCGQQRAGSGRLQRLAHLPAHRVQPGHCRGCRCRGVPVSGSQGQGGRAHCGAHLAGPFSHSGCDPDRVRHCRQPCPAHRHEHPRRGAGGCGALYTALFWRRAVQRGV